VQGKARIQSLIPHAARVVDRPLRDLIAADSDRAQAMSLDAAGLHVSFARQRLDREAMAALLDIAGELDLRGAIRRLFAGERVNTTEGRSALHTALRGDPEASAASREAHAVATASRRRMAGMVDRIRASGLTDVISIGIGGSDLGPRLVVDALGGDGGLGVHFLSNVDGHAVSRLLSCLDPARTAAIVVSKSFTTQETLTNARIVRDWMGEGANGRLYAVSADTQRAADFGVAPGHVLPMWDWVGGRYSLWSAVGLAIALRLGNAAFDELLAGAAQMDAHVHGSDVADNLAVRHALVAVWNRNALGLDTQAVIPYDERLRLLPDFLQQLVMESLGKSVTVSGAPTDLATGPVVWGGAGSDVQHSFFQSLHQGTDVVPVDFIGVVNPDHAHPGSHDIVLANLLAQAQALADGEACEDPHRNYPGGRPSTVILLERLDARSLGALLALYEHSVYLQAALLDINAFDQWGVELGKRLAAGLLPHLADEAGAVEDPVTAGLLAQVRRLRD
jgi:glucose-6-phosphate isomerase